MTRVEILSAVKKVFALDGGEEKTYDLVWRLDTAVPHANISDMIFCPDEERTPEQIVDEALRRERTYAAR